MVSSMSAAEAIPSKSAFESVVRNSCEKTPNLKVFEDGERNAAKQATHSLDAARLIEIDLKGCLLSLAKELFGQGINNPMMGEVNL
jgi:hypothetical protein